jgi:dTDP-4-amino-4,6-dideoxygalactose transaminase
MGAYSRTNFGDNQMKYVQFSKPEIKLTQADMKKIQKSINSGWYCNGEYVQELERHFEDKFNVKHAIACASCTSGLIIAVKALDLIDGVILLPAFTWPSTEYAIRCNGNAPLWCDIDPDTWDINPDLLDNGYTKWWDCQISVDVFGNESYIPFLRNGHDVPTIYDAAHGYGLDNLGHRGDIEVVSLSFTKPVTSMQGGMILFNDESLFENIMEMVKLSAKMTEVNAYVGLKGIESYKTQMKVKEEIRQMYREFITVPYTEQKIDTDSTYSTFSILFNSKKKRDSVAEAFKKNGIEVKIYYEPLQSGLKNTEKVYRRIISLPTYEEMIPEVKRISKLINEA